MLIKVTLDGRETVIPSQWLAEQRTIWEEMWGLHPMEAVKAVFKSWIHMGESQRVFILFQYEKDGNTLIKEIN